MNEPIIGRKDTAGKDPWDLLPMGPIQAIVQVLAYGAKKYSVFGEAGELIRSGIGNWKHVEQPREKYYAATMRHLVSWRAGEIIDPETGLLHLAHAGCNVVFLLWFDLNRPAPANT